MGRFWHRLKKRKAQYARCLLAGLAILALADGVAWMGHLRGIENRVFDALTFWQTQTRDPRMAIVAIDDDAFAAVGKVQPVDRAFLADVVTTVARCAPAAIILDFTFDAPTAPDRDARLVGALRDAARAAPVILAVGPDAVDGARASRRPDLAGARAPGRFYPALEAAVGHEGLFPAFAGVPKDADTVIRRFVGAVRDRNGTALPVLAAAALVHSGATRPDDPPVSDAIELDLSRSRVEAVQTDCRLRLETGRLYPIRFNGPSGTVTTLPAGLLSALSAAVAEDNPLRGSFVFIGATFAEARDAHATPLGEMSGVEVHANVLSTLLGMTAFRRALFAGGLALQLAFCAMTAALFTAFRPGRATVLALLLGAGIFIPASYWLFSRNQFNAFAPSLLAIGLSGLYNDRRRRREVRRHFAASVAPAVVEAVYDDDREILRGGYRDVTILFCDLRGFTRLSYQAPAETLVGFINEFYQELTLACVRNQGMVNKFIGDCILAVFNAPLDDPDHVDHALDTGVAMIATVERLRAQWQARAPGLQVDLGVGIHAGTVFCGLVGSEQKEEYGLIGKEVIVAHELEQWNKPLGTHILVSRQTYERSSKKYPAVDRGEHEVRQYGEFIGVVEIPAGAKNF